ncbi:hypothetical protein AAFF_G00144600, partial [Aldrovandia affinis]
LPLISGPPPPLGTHLFQVWCFECRSSSITHRQAQSMLSALCPALSLARVLTREWQRKPAHSSRVAGRSTRANTPARTSTHATATAMFHSTSAAPQDRRPSSPRRPPHASAPLCAVSGGNIRTRSPTPVSSSCSFSSSPAPSSSRSTSTPHILPRERERGRGCVGCCHQLTKWRKRNEAAYCVWRAWVGTALEGEGNCVEGKDGERLLICT